MISIEIDALLIQLSVILSSFALEFTQRHHSLNMIFLRHFESHTNILLNVLPPHFAQLLDLTFTITIILDVLDLHSCYFVIWVSYTDKQRYNIRELVLISEDLEITIRVNREFVRAIPGTELEWVTGGVQEAVVTIVGFYFHNEDALGTKS